MENWQSVTESFVSIFANLDFSQGALFYVLGIIIAGYCCMEGYKIYKMILGGLGFVFGFTLGHDIFYRMYWPDEQLLMVETFLGLLFMAFAYKIYLVGIFIAVLQFGLSNLPVYVEGYMGKWLNFGSILNGVIVTVLSAILAVIVAKKATDMSRPVIVCLTAVIGGFAIVNYFLGLMPFFPYDVTLPPPESPIYLMAKVFLSAAGAGIQGIKE